MCIALPWKERLRGSASSGGLIPQNLDLDLDHHPKLGGVLGSRVLVQTIIERES